MTSFIYHDTDFKHHITQPSWEKYIPIRSKQIFKKVEFNARIMVNETDIEHILELIMPCEENASYTTEPGT